MNRGIDFINCRIEVPNKISFFFRAICLACVDLFPDIELCINKENDFINNRIEFTYKRFVHSIV